MCLTRKLESSSEALASVRRLRFSERSEMVTRISRMTDFWPWWISALLALWWWASFGRLAASWRADQIRTTRSFRAQHLAVWGRSPYLSASLTAVGPPLCRALSAALLCWLAGKPQRDCATIAVRRRGPYRASNPALSCRLLPRGLPRKPAWGLFVWDLAGVSANREVRPRKGRARPWLQWASASLAG